MAITTHTLSGNLSAIVEGVDLQQVRAQLVPNVPTGAAIISDMSVHFGRLSLTLDSSGAFTQTGVFDTDEVPNLRWRVVVAYVDGTPASNRPLSASSNEFTMTADADLSEKWDQVAPVSPPASNEAVTKQYRDEAEIAAAAAVAVGDTNDAIMAGVAQDSGSAFSGALSATIEAGVTEFGIARYTRIDVVADHGADNTGTTSAVAAFEAAIAAANAAAGKVEIMAPPGTYDLTAGLTTVITKNHVDIVGAGAGVTTFRVTNGTLFQWGDGVGTVLGGGLRDCAITGVAPVGSQRVAYINGGSSQRFLRLLLSEVRQLARLGEPGAGTSSGASFRSIYGNTDPAAGSIVIDAAYGYSLSLNKVVVNAKGVGFPADGTAVHPATDTTFLRFGQATWDTAHCYEVVTNRYNRGLDLNCGSAVNLVNLWFYGCVFDYSKTNGVRLRTNHAGCNIRSVFFDGGWAVASDGHSVEVACTLGTMRSISFSQFAARQAGKNNWRFTGGGSIEGVTLTDCRGMGANRLSATNVGPDQDDVVILAQGVSIIGGRFGEDGYSYTGITPNQGRYGITVGADLASYGIANTLADGATGAFQLPATNASGSRRRLVTNNRRAVGSSALEYALVAVVAAPGSSSNVVETGATVATLYIYGGSVTAVTHNSTTVSDGTGVTLVLRPNDTWSVTYSVAPTIKRVVAP